MKKIIIYASLSLVSLFVLSLLYFNSKRNENIELIKTNVQALTDDDTDGWKYVKLDNSETTQFWVHLPMTTGQKVVVSGLLNILGFVSGVPLWAKVVISGIDVGTAAWDYPPVGRFIKCCANGYDSCYPYAPDKNPIECNSDYYGNSHGNYHYTNLN